MFTYTVVLWWDDRVSMMLKAGKTAACLFNGAPKAPLNKQKRSVYIENPRLNSGSLQQNGASGYFDYVAILSLVEIALQNSVTFVQRNSVLFLRKKNVCT